MTQEEKRIRLLDIEEEIKMLDAEFEEWQENRGNVTGTNAEIAQSVGENIVREVEYRNKRRTLEKEHNELTGVSDAVKSYLESLEKPGQMGVSKLDVQQGRAQIDTSLNPLGGKQL